MRRVLPHLVVPIVFFIALAVGLGQYRRVTNDVRHDLDRLNSALAPLHRMRLCAWASKKSVEFGVLAGMSVPLACWIIFKIGYAPPNDLSGRNVAALIESLGRPTAGLGFGKR